jgi:Domain of unknown function (DUF4434)
MITGTFIDEITHDIPYQNWGPEEWRKDFQAMKAFGIDTVILIRAGHKDRCTFPSKVLKEKHGYLIVQDDLVDLFLTLAEENSIALYFGTYDSGEYWMSGQFQKEVDINRLFVDEFMERYGDRKAFKGWYISHEIDTFDDGVMKVYEQLAKHLRAHRDYPILISPYIRGVKQFSDEAITLSRHEEEWAQVFARIQGLVDIVAFQDGNVEFRDLPEFLSINANLASKYDLTTWSNVETFDRDMHIKFPPIGWPKLKYKVDSSVQAGVDKLITFEFSHFLSPNANDLSARMLNARYCEEYLKEKKSAENAAFVAGSV